MGVQGVSNHHGALRGKGLDVRVTHDFLGSLTPREWSSGHLQPCHQSQGYTPASHTGLLVGDRSCHSWLVFSSPTLGKLMPQLWDSPRGQATSCTLPCMEPTEKSPGKTQTLKEEGPGECLTP